MVSCLVYLTYNPLLAHIITLHLATKWKNPIGKGIAAKTSSGKHALMAEFLLSRSEMACIVIIRVLECSWGRMGALELL